MAHGQISLSTHTPGAIPFYFCFERGTLHEMVGH
jgi:hypothetical protein